MAEALKGLDAPKAPPPIKTARPSIKREMPKAEAVAPIEERQARTCPLVCRDDNMPCGVPLRSDNKSGVCGYHQVPGHHKRRPGTTPSAGAIAAKICLRVCHDGGACGWRLPDANTTGICGYHLSGSKTRRLDDPIAPHTPKARA